MYNATLSREYQESTIDEDPILGCVLALPDRRIQPLGWWDRLLLALGLTNASRLEAKYFRSSSGSD
ncbi:MAG TPA: hypothetical protein VFY73_15350 [Ideonella sp.]|uniref:hypothetical protein n=1 Tax=Ideonella sp. TaxID=1929293 RepID=UPI002E365540|nr:hypothetical protein [Ideonella sp.]HEX5685396.1 hypothetical protein [Ideonella sp.]